MNLCYLKLTQISLLLKYPKYFSRNFFSSSKYDAKSTSREDSRLGANGNVLSAIGQKNPFYKNIQIISQKEISQNMTQKAPFAETPDWGRWRCVIWNWQPSSPPSLSSYLRLITSPSFRQLLHTKYPLRLQYIAQEGRNHYYLPNIFNLKKMSISENKWNKWQFLVNVRWKAWVGSVSSYCFKAFMRWVGVTDCWCFFFPAQPLPTIFTSL